MLKNHSDCVHESLKWIWKNAWVPDRQHLCNFWKSDLSTNYCNFHGYQFLPIVSRVIFVFIWNIIYSETCTWKKINGCGFQLNIWLIDHVLSVNKCYFHTYVDLMYPSERELEIKYNTEFALSVSYLDNFLPYLCSNMHVPLSPVHEVFSLS